MNCQDFEMLMADALGDELSPADGPAFEAHLAECDNCRREYENARRTVETMRGLPGPTRMIVRQEGDRLVFEEKQATGRAVGFSLRGSKTGVLSSQRSRYLRGSTHAARSARGVLRYAASVLIAFAAGYAVRAGLTDTESGRRGDRVVQEVGAREVVAPGDNLRVAFVGAHTRNPARSDLAKCLIAMAHAKD